MQVFNINITWDCAGVGYNLTQALNKYTDIKGRQCVGTRAYQCYPYDIFIYGLEPLKKALQESDILHFNHLDWNTGMQFANGSKMVWKDHIEGKKLVYHNHGGHLPGREEIYLYKEFMDGKMHDKYTGHAKVATCSPNYSEIYRKAQFMPNIIPQNSPLYTPKPKDWSGTIKVCHSPSVSQFKGSDVVGEVLKELMAQKYDIQYEMIVGCPHEVCMQRKSECHIGIDSMVDLHPNISTFENLSLGLISMTNLNEKATEALDGGDKFPSVKVGYSTLYKKLKDLLDNKDELQAKAEASRKWIDEYYTDEKLIKKWVEFYGSC